MTAIIKGNHEEIKQIHNSYVSAELRCETRKHDVIIVDVMKNNIIFYKMKSMHLQQNFEYFPTMEMD